MFLPTPPRAEVVARVPVEAKSVASDPPMELLLFVDNGLLSMLELVDYGPRDAHRDELPPQDSFGAPKVNQR
jgi:hypothetical protein